MLQHKKRAKRATPPKRTATDQTKKEPKKDPKTRKRSRRGWVRIRDINNPRIHTPPQTRPSAKSSWPLPGKSVVVRYAAIAPLSGSALHILTLHFCKCIWPFRVLLLPMNCSISMRLCGLHGVRRLQFSNWMSRVELHELKSLNCICATHLLQLAKQLTSKLLREVAILSCAPSGDSLGC